MLVIRHMIVTMLDNVVHFFTHTFNLVNFINLFLSLLFYRIPLGVDQQRTVTVPGLNEPWPLIFNGDSYSVDDRCYCHPLHGFEDEIAFVLVDTPLGEMTVREVCAALGSGPGSLGRPIYNDIQVCMV